MFRNLRVDVLGAEVIVPAEAVLATLVIANKLKEINGAPVVDCLAIAWRHTLMMIRLHMTAACRSAALAPTHTATRL